MKYLTAVALVLLSGAAYVLARPSYQDERIRSMSSWSGWVPGGGLSMFASSADDPWNTQQMPPVWSMDEDGYPKPVGREQPVAPKRSNKKKAHEQDEEEDDDDSGEHGGSRANASFNAWFPIMLGMYPGSGSEDDGSGRSRAGRPSAAERESVAAVANSVNHGRSGVANSHAIVFSGEPEAYRRRAQQQGQYTRRAAPSQRWTSA